MAITDLKLKDSDITAKGVVAAPTVLAGTPEENKKIFDRLIREVFRGDFNSLIDALTASTGAGEIGASVDGLTGGTVQALLAALKAYVDDWESETITSTVGAAQAAADSAAAAAAAAESISQHPPRVSSSNTWEIWDEDSGAYVDSGKPAKGDPGVSPKITSIEKAQSATGAGYTKINFTDADGAHSITINDGKDGTRGTHGDSVTVTATAADATDEHPNGGVNLVFTLTQYNASGAPPTTLEMPFTVWHGNTGPQGPAGINGKSAYAAAKDGGWIGTESAFNTALAGIVNKANKPVTRTVNLTVAGWDADSLSQTVAVSGMTSSRLIIVTPTPGGWTNWCKWGIRCSAQTTDRLAFKCDTVPTSGVTAQIVMLT